MASDWRDSVPDELQQAWAELDEAIERNKRLVEERCQAQEDAEQMEYLVGWPEEHPDYRKGNCGTALMALLLWGILWGAALWPLIEGRL